MTKLMMECSYRLPLWTKPLVIVCRLAGFIGIRVNLERVADFIANRSVIKVNGIKVERV